MPGCLLLEKLATLSSRRKASAWRVEENHDHQIWYLKFQMFTLANRIFMNLIAEMLSPESRRLNDVANTKGNSSTLCGYGYHMAMIF